MNFLKSNEDNNFEILMREGCITCGEDSQHGVTVDVEDDGGASSDGGNNK